MAPKAYTSFFTDIIACRMYSGAMYPLNMLKKGNTSAKENAGKKKGKTHKHAMYSGQWKILCGRMTSYYVPMTQSSMISSSFSTIDNSKSIILGFISESKRMLPGFRSIWTMCCLCR
jgi:hypothetical protein